MTWVRTVDGTVDIDSTQGFVLPHEHVLLDMRVWWEGDGDPFKLDSGGQGVALENLDWVRRRTHASLRDNLVLSDWYLAARELVAAKISGCTLIVDLTTTGLDPQPGLAAKAARLAGIPLVTSVGRYLDGALPESERLRTVDDIAESWIDVAANGRDGVQVGIIGEIGTSERVTPVEVRSLKAAAIAQRETSLALNIHLHPFARQGLSVLSILESAGADIGRVVLSHCDGEIDRSWLLGLLERGCYVEFDLFGSGPWMAHSGRSFPSDDERIEALGDLVNMGFADRLLVSHDVCMKSKLKAYGGGGYSHIGENIVSELYSRLGEEVADQITRTNPLSVLRVEPERQLPT